MVDASVGGKTGVNAGHLKNMIGTFHKPALVVIDTELLAGLPARHFANGLAEAIKTGAILDEELFRLLEAGVEPGDHAAVLEIVKRTVALKAWVVDQDAKEKGLRAILNYGHTIGHAIEALMDWKLLHGECVAIGMVLEAAYARSVGVTPPACVSRIARCCKLYGLPTVLPEGLPVEDIMAKMSLDKKNDGGVIKVVVIDDIGRARPRAVAMDEPAVRVVLSDHVTVARPLLPPSPQKLTLRVPGSKSISNRVLLLAALGRGECRITGLLHSDDTQVMLDAITQLRAARYRWEGEVLVVEGSGGETLTASAEPIFLGNAGTAARFLTTVCTLARPGSAHQSATRLTGVRRMKERPIRDLVDCLRAAGCSIDYVEAEGCLPIDVRASGLPGGALSLAASTSSQFVSSILLSAPYAQKPLTLTLTDRPVSEPYIEMTVRLMEQFGCAVSRQGNTFTVPLGAYRNPPEVEVEADASSATYPLCVAALAGGSLEVTVQGVGSASLQGDAQFCGVLQKMGCTVTQTASATTVRGPDRLLAVEVDMEHVTDTFMGAAVLCAAAEGVSRLTGIANQRVKECNRIKAMVDELAKCGVTARELPDGLEIEGCGPSARLHRLAAISSARPEIHSYHDHRIAMSFGVLATQAPGIVITQKDCVDKTYPEFWDDLKNKLHAEVVAAAQEAGTGATAVRGKVVLVGMRGAGKTGLARAAGSALGLPAVDLDDVFRETVGDIRGFIDAHGWPAFREREAAILHEVLARPGRALVACGGGVVESAAARAHLRAATLAHAVVHICRSRGDVLAYLASDPTRPPFAEPTEDVWARREPWYRECSSHDFFIAQGDKDWDSITGDFTTLASRLLGLAPTKSTVLRAPTAGPRYYVCLTLPTYTSGGGCAQAIAAASEGCDAVELRADMVEGALEDPIRALEALAQVRRATRLPIIFTARTVPQGGRWPAADAKLFDLLARASRCGAADMIDVEAGHDRILTTRLVAQIRQAGLAEIFGSVHVLGEAARGMSLEGLTALADQCSLDGAAEAVKIVWQAHTRTDAALAAVFAEQNRAKTGLPTSTLCLGQLGRLSRVFADWFVPVTHPSLAKAAPGQMTLDEIKAARQSLF
jgi:pentafunctional AROM polypeptide